MKRKWLLGYTKKDLYGTRSPIYLYDFKFDCGWYWAGGYIGNPRFHAHFNSAFLDRPDSRGHVLGNFFDPWTPPPSYVKNFQIMNNGAAVWEDLSFFLDSPKYTTSEWRRIKDLFEQFYALKAAAEVFQYGGHCTSSGRTPGEIRPEVADMLNHHIEAVIIPAIRNALDHNP